MTNFSDFDSAILDFSERPENSSLLSRTGSYSTLMRGGLFKKFVREDVERELEMRSADLLMLGANPNAGPHQNEVIRATYGTLAMQIATGMLGEQKWDSTGRSYAGWNFLDEANEGWKYFRELLSGALNDLHGVAMANFIPWGSRDMPALAREIDKNTLTRALEFCEDINAKLIALLKPKIVVIPTSLTNQSILNKVYKTNYLSDRNKADKRTCRLGQKNFYFYIGEMEFNGFTTKTLHVAHPSYFSRVGKNDRDIVSFFLQPLIGEALIRS